MTSFSEFSGKKRLPMNGEIVIKIAFSVHVLETAGAKYQFFCPLVHRFLIDDIISYNNPTRNLFFLF